MAPAGWNGLTLMQQYINTTIFNPCHASQITSIRNTTTMQCNTMHAAIIDAQSRTIGWTHVSVGQNRGRQQLSCPGPDSIQESGCSEGKEGGGKGGGGWNLSINLKLFLSLVLEKQPWVQLYSVKYNCTCSVHSVHHSTLYQVRDLTVRSKRTKFN